MPFNGSGNFSIPNTFVYDTIIDEVTVNANFSDIATGLSTCLTKDGQTVVTANIPMATYRFTNVGAAVNATDYARADQIQSNALTYFTASGTNTYTISPSPAITAYAAGQSFLVKFTNANTGAATLNANSLGAKDIRDRNGNALTAGLIPAGSVIRCDYDGTQFVIDPANWGGTYVALTGNQTVAGDKTFTGNPVVSNGDPVLTIKDSNNDINTNGQTGQLQIVDQNNNICAYFGMASGSNQALYIFNRNSNGQMILGTNATSSVIIDADGGVYGPGTTGGSKGADTANFTEIYKSGVKASGATIDRAFAQYTSVAELTSAIPFDDTTPTSSEGTQILSANLTPKASTHRVRGRVTGFGGTESTQLTVAIFRATTCIQVVSLRQVASGNVINFSVDFEDAPSTTSSTTYSVRVGAAGGSAYVNADNLGNRKFGGTAKATLVLEEVVA